MSRPTDPVDQAFSLLREDSDLAMPDPQLEKQLRNPTQPRRHWRLGWVAVAVFAVSVAGTGWAAQQGLLKSWWYRIVVGETQIRGVADGPGVRVFDHELSDGTQVRIRVSRAAGPQAVSRIEVSQSNEGMETQDVEEFRRSEPTLAPRSEIADLTPLHLWKTAQGWRRLYIKQGPPGSGSEILVEALDQPDGRCVQLVGRLPPTLRSLDVSLQEQENGSLHLILDCLDESGRSLERHLEIGVPPSSPGAMRYQSPDGRVRVDVGD